MHLAGNVTLGEILPSQAARADLAKTPALFFGEASYTYADLRAAADNAAGWLEALGIVSGDVVAFVLPNAPAMVALLFGAFSIGVIVVPLNSALTAPELLPLLAAARVRLLVTSNALAPRFEDLRTVHPNLPPILALDIERPLDCSSIDRRTAVVGRADQTAFVIFTSGTTGRAKGVVLSHRNVLANTAQVAERTALRGDDRVLHIMPLFHVNGLMNNTILPLRAGASIVLRPRFDLGEFWGVIAAHRPTYFTAVPTVFARLMDAWKGDEPVSSLRFVRSGAAPMTQALQDQVEQRLGVPVIVSYGLSEATCTCTMNPADWQRRPGSVGAALGGCKVVALGARDQPLPPGEIGEIAVMGPNVMVGYLDAPEATEQALRGGWLHTGDMGYVDEDGFVFLSDRLKDLIVRGGENISPREVEDVLLAHPEIAEAAVVGAKDREWGEVVVAFLVPVAGQSPEQGEVERHCRAHLARFKLPSRIEFLSELPVTTVGKVDKARLRAIANSDENRSAPGRGV